MPELQIRKVFSFPRPAHASCFELQSVERRANQDRRKQQRAGGSFRNDVVILRMKRERPIVRERPRSRRPDDRSHIRTEFFATAPGSTANFTQMDGLV